MFTVSIRYDSRGSRTTLLLLTLTTSIILAEDVPVLCSQRWILAYISFLGFCVVFALRVNISVAIVCMVKSPQLGQTAPLNLTLNATSDTVNNGVCVAEMHQDSESSDRGELDWTDPTKAGILASFYYGYMVTQMPGGWLADRYGGKRVFGYTTFVSSILTVLTPISARTSVYLVYAIRVLLGLLTATSIPAMQSMWGKWAPPMERSKLTSLCFAGQTVGNVLTFSTSGLLCAYGFDNGWGSIFYITGSLGVVWCGAWFYISADTPTKHPRIEKEERVYITSSMDYNTLKKTRNVPWLSLAKTPCLWACVIMQVSLNWSNYTLLTNIPTFMKDVLKFDIKMNGALSALPYVCSFLSMLSSGHIADFIRSRELLSTTNTRKVMQSCSLLGICACLVGTGFCSCSTRTTAVALLSLAQVFMGFGIAGIVVNYLDFAPKFAGLLYGIANTCSSVTGMTAPLLAGYLTPNHTAEEWRNVFYVCAGFLAVGVIIYAMFASGEIQEWAKDDMNIDVPEINKTVDKPDVDIHDVGNKDITIGIEQHNGCKTDNTHCGPDCVCISTHDINKPFYINSGYVPNELDINKLERKLDGYQCTIISNGKKDISNNNKNTIDMSGNCNTENQKMKNGLTKYMEQYNNKGFVNNDVEQNTHM